MTIETMHLRRPTRSDPTCGCRRWVNKQTVVIVVVVVVVVVRVVDRCFAAMLDLVVSGGTISLEFVGIAVVIINIIIIRFDVTNVRRVRSHGFPIFLGQVSTLRQIVTVVTRPICGAAQTTKFPSTS